MSTISMRAKREVATGDRISRGLATARGYRKLKILPKDADLGAWAKRYDGAYNAFDATGERYVMPLIDDPINLCCNFCRAYSVGGGEPFLPLWGKYSLDEYNFPKYPDAITVRAMLVGSEDNGLDEVGLYLTHRTVRQQKVGGDRMISRYNKEHDARSMMYLDPVGYLCLNAIRLELGEHPLDHISMGTRFVDMPEKEAGSLMVIPSAYWSKRNKQHLCASVVDSKLPHVGIRFSIG